MTLEEFDNTLANLLKLVLPPNVSDDMPVSPEQVLQVLEDQTEAVRGMVIKRKRELNVPHVTDTPNLSGDK